jgi:glycosyltransferase involved in cell wall biosynthesis
MLASVSVRWWRPGDTLAASREGTVVCLVHEGVSADTAAALVCIAGGTPDSVPVLVVGSEHDEDLGQADIGGELIAIPARLGAPTGALVARAVEVAAPADVLLLGARSRVPPGWLERLSAAARSDDTIATATALTNDGGPVSVPEGPLENTDQLVASAAWPAYPRVLIGGAQCLYVRRRAIELIGGIPEQPASLEELVAALCQAFISAGMVNVLADDLYVALSADSEQREGGLTSALRELDRSDEQSALRRTVAFARVAVAGLTVTIDARALGPGTGGTQFYTRELALALARRSDIAVRVVTGPDIGAHETEQLSAPGGIEIINYDQAVAGVDLSDVVHRPQQVFSVGDLNLLRLLGRRLVVTHQDLIAYHNPSYHGSLESWEQYRRVTRMALGAADRVVFFSEHSRRDALAEDLVTAQRTDVIGVALGRNDAAGHSVRRPSGVSDDRPFILCLGPDYRHKNRPFALRLMSSLLAHAAWPGMLVMAGAHVPHGSSRSDEEALLAADPELRQAVVELGVVDDDEREWLFQHARAVIVPSVFEGFGLIPLEAARVGRPCLFAAQSSLSEVLSGSLATLVPWDASASAHRVLPLLEDSPAQREHIAGLRAAAERWSWDAIGEQLVDSYTRALRAPFRAAAVRAWQELERERHLEEAVQTHHELLAHLGDRIALASDEGVLSARQQRGLLRVGSRPAIARLLLWPFAALGSVRPPDAKRRDE